MSISLEQRRIIRSVLVEIIGPMADIYLDNYAQEDGNIEDVISVIASNLSADDEVFFKTEVNKQLGRK